MSRTAAVGDAFRRYPRMLFVIALVAAMMIPNMIMAIADTNDNTVYTLTAPCTVFDTRSWDMDGDGTTDPKPTTEQEMSFYVADNTDNSTDRTHQFGDNPETTQEVESHQGGTFGGCGVPETATGVLLNLVAVSPAGDGNLRAYGWGDSESATGGVLVYDSSQSVGIANMIMVELDTSATAESGTGGTETGGHIEVFVNGPATHVRGIVMGYLMADDAA